ncbi:MAG: DNA-deoxyinosine glycosylase [Clostridia bacterium]|nr:DNA-deoxyinosine glycosylase [Clostridia bacterium]
MSALEHPFDPVWDADCRLLILGTFPSVKSRENAFYYGHPQNRFWRVLGAVYHEPAPQTVGEKRAFLLRHHIALWDVIAQCEITGSADSSIRRAVPNDLPGLMARCLIRRILLNGKTAEKIYLKYWKALDVPHAVLPSTSPANAAWTLERLRGAWTTELGKIEA